MKKGQVDESETQHMGRGKWANRLSNQKPDGHMASLPDHSHTRSQKCAPSPLDPTSEAPTSRSLLFSFPVYRSHRYSLITTVLHSLNKHLMKLPLTPLKSLQIHSLPIQRRNHTSLAQRLKERETKGRQPRSPRHSRFLSLHGSLRRAKFGILSGVAERERDRA